MTIEEFAEALGADVVIQVGKPGALSLPQALALRDWWDRERRVPPKRDADG